MYSFDTDHPCESLGSPGDVAGFDLHRRISKRKSRPKAAEITTRKRLQRVTSDEKKAAYAAFWTSQGARAPQLVRLRSRGPVSKSVMLRERRLAFSLWTSAP